MNASRQRPLTIGMLLSEFDQVEISNRVRERREDEIESLMAELKDMRKTMRALKGRIRTLLTFE